MSLRYRGCSETADGVELCGGPWGNYRVPFLFSTNGRPVRLPLAPLILGTYSSIYVALPLTHWLDRKVFAKIAPRKARGAVRSKKAEAVV